MELHGSLQSPISESMNFLNEVAHRYPDAISFAAGRPYEGFFDLDAVHRYLETYRKHLQAAPGADEAQVLRTLLQYGRTKGIIHQLIARNLLVDEGITVDAESIVVTVGCQEALYLTLRALRRTDRDALLVVPPTYIGAYGAAQLADMKLLPVRSTPEGVDVDDLVSVLRNARAQGLRPRACYLTPNFTNPTGVSLDLETRRTLLRVASEHGFLLLEDNPYGIFHGDEEQLPTLKALDRSRSVVYLGSYAKSGIPGARVGFVVADQRVAVPNGGTTTLADELAKIKSVLTVNTSPLAQAVIGGKLLEHGCSLRDANARETKVYRDNLRAVLDGLAARFAGDGGPPVSWNTPRGGFFLCLDLPFAAGDRLLEHCARTHRVLFTPMHHFYGDDEPRRQIRLSFSHLTPDEIEDGLDRLAAFVAEQSRQAAQ
ncbi:PLP-dependent aminotransferase family protein (plasmid) [Streptomyces cellulosae]|uniref:aminotransferase-like domain-containing protein n=1 Tax=Streptomyces cellulosae TaxID=1968 RepID=UPI002F91B2CF|nr:PLP-dependent aminotransferase family protein [Streptomyces cellulosae]WTB86364.1 PLP-dependent aminotransferase family protein [Streptomyces cellulosae]WTB86743.1 PLP-dependent aminotransferase family protein [Streptomyces cellulosae]WTB92879.1 PLP-dependent aminotransferase family protein [Streptomyces cellulosae]WTB93218.1 PLP-dependent aminotransferase family protein [Streptomyces cellulosae]